MWRLLCTASVALGVVLATVAAATAAGTAPAGWLVFSATPTGSTTAQLFRIQTSGEGLQQITSGALSAIDPTFSPDGKRIAFSRSGVGIFTMNLDGTSLRRLTTNGRDSYPTWSPDGKRVAFVRPGISWNVYVMPSAGGAAKRLLQAPPAGRPSWTARALLIPTGGDLVRILVTTGRVQKYYGAEIDAVWGMNTVAVAPAGTTITYVGARKPDPGDTECGESPCPRFALYIEDIRKPSKPRLLVRDAGPATFSPNGRQLAFVSHGGLALWSLAAGRATQIKTGKAYPTVSAPPAWQPR
jgi:Tol biopolymer transport system component